MSLLHYKLEIIPNEMLMNVMSFFSPHLMLKYLATALQKRTNLHTQQSLDAHSFLHVKACLLRNICCWDVEMPACFSQFCWTCLLPLWEQSNTTSLVFVATGRRHQTGVHEYYSLAATETSPHWLRRPCEHTGHAYLNTCKHTCKPGLKYSSWGTHNVYSTLGHSCLTYYFICNCQIKLCEVRN